MVTDTQSKEQAKYINETAIRILYFLYLFRFSTPQQINFHVNRNDGKNIHRPLHNLMRKDLIMREYEGTYRLWHQPSRYYLTRAGYEMLKERGKAPLIPWSTYVRQLNTKPGPMQSKIMVHAIINRWVSLSGVSSSIYPQLLLKHNARQPEKTYLPDALITMKGRRPRTYYLDVIAGSPQSLHVFTRLKHHVQAVYEQDQGQRCDGLIIIFDTLQSMQTYKKRLLSLQGQAMELGSARIFLTTFKSFMHTDADGPLFARLDLFKTLPISLKDL